MGLSHLQQPFPTLMTLLPAFPILYLYSRIPDYNKTPRGKAEQDLFELESNSTHDTEFEDYRR